MKKRNKKLAYRRIRVPLIRQTGGAHTPDKGGKYRRDKEKQMTRREIKTELD